MGDDVESGNIDIYSLRSNEGESHVTVGIEEGTIIEFKGKSNKAPLLKYIKLAVPFLRKVDWDEFSDDTFWNSVTPEYAVELYKELPELFDFIKKLRFYIPLVEKDLNIDGDLDLYNTEITNLPDNLNVKRALDLRGTEIANLPNNLTVGGYLNIKNTNITSLPSDLKVGGILYLTGTQINSLPNNLSVGGSLYLMGTQINSLPDNLNVGGHLYIKNTNITSLPSDLKVGGKIYKDFNKIVLLFNIKQNLN